MVKKEMGKGMLQSIQMGTRMEQGIRLTKCAVSTSIWNCVLADVLRSVLSTCEHHVFVSP
jgi:hypothetical protein